MNSQNVRPLLAQQFSVFNLTLSPSARPINPNGSVQDLITSFLVSNPSANSDSVWLGQMGVTAGQGAEIQPGADPLLIINQTRQLYELQNPIVDIDMVARCNTVNVDRIPLAVWDLSRIFLVTAGASVPVTVIAFPEMFV